MRSLRISAAPKGFTLIEIAIVTGLVASLVSVGMLASSGAYERAAFRSERDSLIAALRTARARSVSGVGGPEHGVHFSLSGCRSAASCYVLFDGPAYASQDAANVEIAASATITVGWPAVDPVFHGPDGAAEEVRITLSRGRLVIRITVNEEGRIDYE